MLAQVILTAAAVAACGGSDEPSTATLASGLSGGTVGTVTSVTTPSTNTSITKAPAPTTTTAAISTLGSVKADVPFAQMSSGNNMQLMGDYPRLQDIPEATGYVGSDTVLGSRMRFGKVNDPAGASRKVFRHAMRSSDPYTAGSVNRVDMMPPGQNISKDVTYWAAWDMYLPSNTYFANDWTTLVNLHPGGSANYGNWSMQINKGQLVFAKGSVPPSTQNTYWNATSTPLADQWIRVVVKFRMSTSNSGLLQLWVNGNQMVNDTGANTPDVGGDYVKMAFYNYSWAGGYGDSSRPEREMFYGQFHIVQDSGHTATQVSALLN